MGKGKLIYEEYLNSNLTIIFSWGGAGGGGEFQKGCQ